MVKFTRSSIYLAIWVSALFCSASLIAQPGFHYSFGDPLPLKNPRGVNKELDNASVENGWKLLSWDSTKPGYSNPDTIPFDFKVRGVKNQVFRAAANGSITFMDPSFFNAYPIVYLKGIGSLPDPRIPEKSIGFFGLRKQGDNDQVYVKTFGTAPNRQYWVKFHSFSLANDSVSGYASYGYFSVVIEEGSGDVFLVQMAQGNSVGIAENTQVKAELTMGINWSGFEGIMVADRFSNPTPFNVLDKNLGFQSSDNRYYCMRNGMNPLMMDAQLLQDFSKPLYQYVKLGDGVEIPFKIQFLPDTLIQGYELHVSLNGASPEIFPLDNYKGADLYNTIPFSVKLNHSSLFIAGNRLKVSAWLKKVSGTADLNASNDSLINFWEFIVQNQAGWVKTSPVMEVFTGNWNSASALADVHLDTLVKQNLNMGSTVILNHHVMDPMKTDLADVQRKVGNDIASGAFPVATVNRGLMVEKMKAHWGDKQVLLLQDSWLNAVNEAAGMTSPVDLQILDVKYDAVAKKVTGKLSVKVKDHLANDFLRVQVLLMETEQKGNTSNWWQKMDTAETRKVGSKFYGKSTRMRGYGYKNVVMKYDFGVDGKAITSGSGMLTVGSTYDLPFSMDVPDTQLVANYLKAVDFADSGKVYLRYKPADFRVVALATDRGSMDVFRLAEAVNAAPIIGAKMQAVWDFANGIDPVVLAMQLKSYPNPVDDVLRIESDKQIRALEVSSVTGAKVLGMEAWSNGVLDVRSLPAGMYVVKVKDEVGPVGSFKFIKK